MSQHGTKRRRSWLYAGVALFCASGPWWHGVAPAVIAKQLGWNAISDLVGATILTGIGFYCIWHSGTRIVTKERWVSLVYGFLPDSFTASWLAERVAELGRHGHHDEVIKECNKGIELHPKYAWFYYYRGLACVNKRQYDRAIADANQAIELDPDFAWAYMLRGMAYRKKVVGARYTSVYELSPADFNAYELALTDFNKAIELADEFERQDINKIKNHCLRLGGK
jgi:tetratricopeptide (TPR) repeat protein